MTTRRGRTSPTLVWLVGLDLYYGSSAPIAGFDWIVVAAFAVATGVLAYRVVTEFWRGLKEAAESSERE